MRLFATLRLIVALCLCLELAGAHWVILQVCAWTNMAITYSHHSGLERGLSQTFDGAHPCPLCNAVQHGAEKEKKSTALAFAPVKVEALLNQAATLSIAPPRPFHYLAAAPSAFLSRPDAPPVPPPRFLV